MNSIIKKNGLRYGLITAVVSTLYTFGAYVIDERLFSNLWISFVIMFGAIALFVISTVKSKKEMGGFISFREAFSAFMIGAIVYLLVVTVMNVLLFHVVDPGLADRVKEMTIEKSLAMYEKFNMPEEKIDEAIAQLESQDTFSIKGQLVGIFSGIVFFAIFGVISSLILKKNKPMWDAVDNLDENN